MENNNQITSTQNKPGWFEKTYNTCCCQDENTAIYSQKQKIKSYENGHISNTSRIQVYNNEEKNSQNSEHEIKKSSQTQKSQYLPSTSSYQIKDFKESCDSSTTANCFDNGIANSLQNQPNKVLSTTSSATVRNGSFIQTVSFALSHYLSGNRNLENGLFIFKQDGEYITSEFIKRDSKYIIVARLMDNNYSQLKVILKKYQKEYVGNQNVNISINSSGDNDFGFFIAQIQTKNGFLNNDENHQTNFELSYSS